MIQWFFVPLVPVASMHCPTILSARRGLCWLLLAALLGGVPAATAVEADGPTRPRIGLVLSGGGARGAAHVGVLRVMEELHIPVHVVVGTSMGSIVGGLYAAGLSPDEMQQAFVTIDWGEAFNDKPDRQHIAFRRKQDDFEALLPFELGVGKGGFSMRSGIINGQKINLILRQLIRHTVGIDRFDERNIPYRAVAADLATGDAVILDRGDLALAMRASMSVPGVFTPVEIDGRVLIDGGIAMNLPIAVAHSLGAERIIAVDVGTPPKELSDSLSTLGVVGQTIAVLAERNVTDSLELLTDDDLLIVPELDAIGSSDFDKLLEGAVVGEQAARRVESALRRFSVSEDEFAEFLVSQRKAVEHDPLTVDKVEVRGLDRTRPNFVTRRLRTKPGEPFTYDDVNADLERIQQLGEFESVDARLVQVGEEKSLLFDARPKSWGPGYLRFGLGVESSFEGDSDFRAIINHRRAEINRRGGEWKTLVSIGEPFSVATELFQPLDLGGIHWFVEPNLVFIRDKEGRFLPGGAFEVVQSDEFVAGFDMGVQFRNWGEIRAGVRRGGLDGEVVTGAAFPDIDVDIGGWRLQATLDQLDNVFFPRRGGLVELTGFFSRDSLGADTQYDKVELRALKALSFGKDSFIAGLDLGTDLGSDIPFHDEFLLGGFLNLSGLTRGELQGDVKALASLGYYRQIAELGALGRGLYVGAVAQAGNAWADVESVELSDLVYSGTIFAGLDTALAPIYVGWGRAEDGQSEFYLFIGRAFR